MLNLKAKKREKVGKKVKKLRKKGILPAVLYGPEIKSLPLEVDLEGFKKIYQEAGESSLISLEIEGGGEEAGKYLVLIHQIKRDPLTNEFIHADFYQPNLKKEVEVAVPLVFVGEAPAVKEMEGTLVKEIQEIEVKALPQNLPHEIKVDVEGLKTFEDEILVKDLKTPENVKIEKGPEEIVAKVVPPEKVEEELEKPIEEKVEEVEKVEKEKTEEAKKEEEEKGTEEKSK